MGLVNSAQDLLTKTQTCCKNVFSAIQTNTTCAVVKLKIYTN